MRICLIAIVLALLPVITYAGSFGYSVDYIHGEGNVDGIKLAARYDAGTFDAVSQDIRLFWESSVNFWEYGAQDEHDTDFVFAVSPVLGKMSVLTTSLKIVWDL